MLGTVLKHIGAPSLVRMVVARVEKERERESTQLVQTMCEFGSIVLYRNLMFYANIVGIRVGRDANGLRMGMSVCVVVVYLLFSVAIAHCSHHQRETNLNSTAEYVAIVLYCISLNENVQMNLCGAWPTNDECMQTVKMMRHTNYIDS